MISNYYNILPDPFKEENADKFDHVEDWTEEDFEELEDEEELEDDCQERGGCMPDPEDFDD